MEVNMSEVAQFLMNIRSKSSAYSKQDMKAVFTKLYYILIDVDDVSPPSYKQYESRSVSANQLGQICELLSNHEKETLTARTEQRLLVSILEITMGSLMELTNRKIENVVDIFIQYYYKGGVNDIEDGILKCDFILDKLTKCFDLKMVKRTV